MTVVQIPSVKRFSGPKTQNNFYASLGRMLKKVLLVNEQMRLLCLVGIYWDWRAIAEVFSRPQHHENVEE
jgi:hypothetical protein